LPKVKKKSRGGKLTVIGKDGKKNGKGARKKTTKGVEGRKKGRPGGKEHLKRDDLRSKTAVTQKKFRQEPTAAANWSERRKGHN